MPSPGEYRFNPDVKAIRAHPVQEDLGRNWLLDLGIVSDERVFLEMLANSLPRKKRDAWVSELATARHAFEKQHLDVYELGLKYSKDTNTVHPAVSAKEVHDFLFYNNNSWGMWPSAATSTRSMHMYLFQENLRYDKMAEGLGARGEYVQTPEQLREALKRSYQVAVKESLSTVINVLALKEFTSARHYPPGVALNPEPGVGAFAH
jgi:thiamine pyrophosphate-dependent acetolactate synthase large subunit-like protein